MPEADDTPTPEPVLLGYVLSIIVGVLASFGVDIANEWVVKIATGIAGLVAVALSAWITRHQVTPESKAVVRIEAAKAEAAAQAAPPVVAPSQPNITVDLTGASVMNPDLLVAALKAAVHGGIDITDVDPVAPPAPPAPPPPPSGAKPSTGLPIDWANTADMPMSDRRM